MGLLKENNLYYPLLNLLWYMVCYPYFLSRTQIKCISNSHWRSNNHDYPYKLWSQINIKIHCSGSMEEGPVLLWCSTLSHSISNWKKLATFSTICRASSWVSRCLDLGCQTSSVWSMNASSVCFDIWRDRQVEHSFDLLCLKIINYA